MRAGNLCWGAVAAAVALAAGAGPARAEEPYAVSVEGGVGQYSGSLGSALKLGGAWGVRMERLATPWLQVGLAYVGAANQVSADVASAQPVLQRDGGEVAVKALLLGGGVRPYVEAGAGLARFHVRGGDAGPAVRSATTFTVPVGLGLQAAAGVIRVGLGVGGELLLGSSPIDGAGGVRLDAMMHLGARF